MEPKTPTSHARTLQDSGSVAAAIYAAVRPSGREPALEGRFPKLTVELRPYQRRAAGWMVSREVHRLPHELVKPSSRP